MNLGITDRLAPVLEAVRTFIRERVEPVEEEFLAEVRSLHERLPALDLNQTLVELTRLVARLGPGDGHSRVRL